MAYLNDVRIVSYLATKPELALSKSGRRYCNFSVRLVYHNNMGEALTDYINTTCFDDDAEVLVRDGNVGDTILLLGYIAQQHWWVNENHFSKVVVICDNLQIMAKGDGSIPPVSVADLAQAQASPYNIGAGITDYMSTQSVPFQKTERFANMPNAGAMYPQPKKDGTWQMPISTKGMQAVERFLSQRPDVASNAVTRGENENDSDAYLASRLLPEDLPVRFGKTGTRLIDLPDGKYVTEETYMGMLKKQSEWLASMKTETRDRILCIAKERFGLELEMCGLPNRLKRLEPQKTKKEGNESEENKNKEKKEKLSQSLFGQSKEDWYQDADGQWKMKER